MTGDERQGTATLEEIYTIYVQMTAPFFLILADTWHRQCQKTVRDKGHSIWYTTERVQLQHKLTTAGVMFEKNIKKTFRVIPWNKTWLYFWVEG